ncbi:MAG: selenocysteine-specific translation elongation factor [Gemmatimonas sp.]|nr:selenocysteine-specific translation elongation factor [Gemmatimonas sp.]
MAGTPRVAAARRPELARAPAPAARVPRGAPHRWRPSAPRRARVGAARGGRVILGTAGHIDHGKTALVCALTGVDTDRLPEEKRRGITIELGFAPLELDGVGTLGVVDVPGHEAFVRTMLAGAAGVDLALLVVAADEGVMPQTREHLAILGALGIRGGVVALTKSDLVDAEMRALAVDDVAALLEGSALAGAEVVPVSARTGDGLDALRRALAVAAAAVPARDADDAFRMPVDRVFSVKGTGTVATGTVWSGSVRRDDTLRAFPGGATLRVRGVETHGHAAEVGSAGQRVALALAGAERDALARGAVLVGAREPWVERDRMRADVALFDDAPVVLAARTRVRLHLGTADVGARVVARGGPVRPGAAVPVRLVLDQALVARGGDRFVLRTASPALTIGGGIITDPAPPFRRTPPFRAAEATHEQRLRWMIEEEAGRGLAVAVVPMRLGLTPGPCASVFGALSADTVRVGERLVERRRLDLAERALVEAVDAAHAARPLDRGTPLQALRARLGVGGDLADWVLKSAIERGRIAVADGLVSRAGWQPTLSADDRAALESIERLLEEAGREAPTATEIAAAAGPRTPALLRLLEREGRVVPIGEERFLSPRAWRDALRALREATQELRSYSAGEFREIFGVSRKYAIPLIEGCDRLGVCTRVGEGRRFHWDRLNPAVASLLDSTVGEP